MVTADTPRIPNTISIKNNTQSNDIKSLTDKDQEEFCYDNKQSPPRFSGYVKFFNTQKGYGFLIPLEDISQHYPSKNIPSESTYFIVFIFSFCPSFCNCNRGYWV